MNHRIIYIVFLLLLFTGSAIAAPQKGTMKDPRDGKNYKTVKIGNQTWMAENMNFATPMSSCYWGFPDNCKKSGRLYGWQAALFNACPDGWHLPTKEEFEKLIEAVGGRTSAKKMLKSKSGWKNGDNGTDAFGFSVLPAGVGYLGFYDQGGKGGFFWSSTLKCGQGVAFGDDWSSDTVNVMMEMSVRCLKGKRPKREKSNENSDRCLEDESQEKDEIAMDSQKEVVTEFQDSSFEDSIEKVLTDPRDEKLYKIIKIGEQTWMAENLNYETENSFCYDDESANCEKYGRLYTWEAAMGACPSGWRLPKVRELKSLIFDNGGPKIAGKVLKSTSGWQEGGNGSKEDFFFALPAGSRTSNGDFYGKEYNTSFWSFTESGQNAYSLELYHSYDDANLVKNGNKLDAISVRCVKDSP